MFDCDRAFVNINANEKLFILNKTILNVLSKFVPHETFTVDDKESLWLIKKIYQKENYVYKSYWDSKNNNNIHHLRKLKLKQELHDASEVLKVNYYSRITYKLTHL